MGEGARFKAGMPLESMNGLTQRAKKGAALLERGTLGGRFNGTAMRALLFVLSERRIAAPVQAMMEPMMELGAGIGVP